VFLYFKFLERDGNRGLGLLPLYSLDWIGLDWGTSEERRLQANYSSNYFRLNPTYTTPVHNVTG